MCRTNTEHEGRVRQGYRTVRGVEHKHTFKSGTRALATARFNVGAHEWQRCQGQFLSALCFGVLNVPPCRFLVCTCTHWPWFQRVSLHFSALRCCPAML